jgi:CDGSH-type Zn-finger protein/uncharacterized Fe-S cluster protein YjdI
MNALTDDFHETPSREQLLYWLYEASEIEHNLMCCYLYAAFSLKLADARWTPTQVDAVARWRRQILTVALEEMTHLCLVGNLMNALGASAHLGRPVFPIESGPYPEGFVIRLQPFSAATIEHFQFLERPPTAELRDAEGFAPRLHYQRTVPPGRLSPGARDYETVGQLYETIERALERFVAEHGEASTFIGDRARQIDGTMAPLPGISAVTDLTSAHQALHTIVVQGEGASEHEDSHFKRFTRIASELRELTAEDPTFSPAWPAATNPVMNAPLVAAERVHISHPDIARWLDIGNALYTTSLRCLLQAFDATSRKAKGAWLSASFGLMRALTPVGQGLAARPATLAPDSPNAGLTFTSLRTLAALPESTAAAFLSARIDELLTRARALPVVTVEGESASTWGQVIEVLTREQSRLAALASAPPAPSVTAPSVTAPSIPSAPAPPPPAARAEPAPAVEVARGKSLTIFFEGKRCIHSRHCVLEAPTVFKANTPGEWIFPDTMALEPLIEVAHHCPSGAIRYERHDGGPAEAPPPVNVLRVRENGPYALHAELSLASHPEGFRVTLCRCGKSSNKPFCDGSHVAAGFVASGEPPTGSVDPLAVRNGPLSVTPLLNGPLHVEGNLELCAGTGRVVARFTEARLCRCGQSRNKPFCDLSHVAAGFEAPGD